MRIIGLLLLVAILPIGARGQTFATLVDKYPSMSLVEQLRVGAGAAPTTLQPRPLVPVALGLIKDFEGWSAIAYNDAVGYCTIGFGHLIDTQRCETLKANGKLGEFDQALSMDRGTEMLERDTVAARLAVQELLSSTDLTREQFGALASFVFNVGARNFATSRMLRTLKADYPDRLELAAKEFRRWTLAGNVELPGLVTRRVCEELLFRGRLKAGSNGQFDRAACAGGAGAAGSDRGLPVDILRGEGPPPR